MMDESFCVQRRSSPSDALHVHKAKFGDGLMTMLMNLHGPSVRPSLVETALHRVFFKYPYLNYRLQVIPPNQEEEDQRKPETVTETLTCSSKFHRWVKYDEDNFLLEVVEAQKYENGEEEETPLQVFERKTNETAIPLESPYLRVFFIKATSTTMIHLGFVFNHALMDGSSRLVFVHEFLNFLKQIYLNEEDESITRYEIPPISLPELFELLPDDCRNPVSLPSMIHALPFDIKASNNTRQRFFTTSLTDQSENDNVLQKLSAKCRENGVTIHSALTAGFVIQVLELLRQKPSIQAEEGVKTFLLGTPVNLRPHLLHYLENTQPEVAERVKTLANFIGVIIYTFQSDNKLSSFWELAKDVKKLTNEQMALKEPLRVIGHLLALYEKMPLGHFGLLVQKPTDERDVRSSVTISNLGFLSDISKDYGPFRVESLPAFFTNGKPGSSFPFWVGVHTIRNTLHLSVSYREPTYSRQTVQAIANGVINQLRENALS